MSGSELMASFVDPDAIDEFVITVAPVLIGDAIPLIARRRRRANLGLIGGDRFADGVAQLRYRITKDASH